MELLTMANQISVNTGSGSGAQQVIVDSNGNITVTVSRSVIGTVANVASANYANFAGNVVNAAQPNITSVGTLSNLTVSNMITTNNLVVTGNFSVGNLVANNANYANFAGNAFAVAGANVTGAVANATFATTAGSANTANSATVANSANAVAGANVSGTVANATYAANAGNANFANSATVAASANSVTLANVSGAGNIAGINLDGNVSNLLTGNGTFVAIPTGGSSNFANFAGEVTSSSQPNITSTGNLTSFTVNDGINGNTLQYNPAGIAIGSNSYAEVQYSDTITATDAYILGNVDNNTRYAKDWYGSNGANTLLGPTMTVGAGITGIAPGDTVTVGDVGFSMYTTDSNLVTGNTALKSSFNMGQVLNFISGAPHSTPSGLLQTFSYGSLSTPSDSTLIRSVRRRGDGAARLSLEPNDYLGNIEWRGSRGGGSAPTGNRWAKIAPRVDSSYVANTSTQPVGIEFWVTDNSTARSQVFHANGNVTFNNAVNANVVTANYLYGDGSNITGISATNANYANFAGNAFSVDGGNVVGAVANATFALDAGNANIANIAYSVDAANVVGLGNIATINLDGNASNFLDGTGNFVAAPGGANANYANFAGDVINSAQPNITSVGNLSSLTVTGNLTSNTVTWSNTITYTGNAVVSDKIFIQSDLAGTNATRNLGLRAGNITNASASNTQSGGFQLNGGTAISTDAGNVFWTRSGPITLLTGQANTPNGAAFTGAVNIIQGAATSTNGNATVAGFAVGGAIANATTGNAIIQNSTLGAGTATATNGNAFGGTTFIFSGNTRTITSGNAFGGTISITSGNARSENGNAVSGNVNISTASAVANVTAGTATVGSININTGTINGITAQVAGNINIGTSGALSSINLGQSSTAVNLPGNLVANIVSANYLYGDGSNITGISATNANYANFAGNAFSVDGSNVVGAVANATFALDAGNANIANIAYSVDAANVSGLGNIATINLDGNASNLLDGTGNFVAIPSVGTPNSIQNGNSIVQFTGPDGELLISTNNLANVVTVSGKTLSLFGANTGGGDISKIELINGALNWQLDNTQFSGGTPFGMTRYNTGFLEPLNFYTARGNNATPADVQTGDNAYSERVQVLYNGTTHGIFNGDVAVRSFSPSNAVAATYSITSADDQANSVFQVNFGAANVAGDLNATGNINVNSGNVIIGADGRLDYLRTFGSFTSNATQTSNGANTTNYMTLNNTEDANGISIASSTQITVARPGRYNIQFSAQLEKTDSGSDIIEIWLDKNGTAVANSATQIQLAGNNAKSVAAWDFNVNAANVNDYFRLAWASPDTDVQITAVPAANTISGVAIPSVILDINPIGA
jgi:hypothetical protein